MHPESSQVAAISLFASLRPAELERVCSWMEVRTADVGTRIITEGAPGYFFFVLQEGTAVVSQGDVELGRINAGDHFGEFAILGDGRRTASVTATSACTLLVMFGTEFRQLEQEMPEQGAAMRRGMAERLPGGG